jgi:hypothetical protein
MSVTISGANQLYKNIDKIAQWSLRDSAKLQAIGERVGGVYANYLKANVKDLDKDTSLRGRKIKKGQLRRSSGTWQPSKDSNTILAGPRTKAIGKRGKTTKYADGFYAHIVEKGDFSPRFGGKHRTQNTGVFSRGMKATKNRSEKLQFILLKREFANYAKGL